MIGFMINRERMISEFLELVQISSLSKKEGAIARQLRQTLEAMGAEVEVDDAGQKVGGETGNVIARFKGTVPATLPLLLSAHMDTVVPGENVKPIIEGDVVRTDGTTVLGGDDKAGIVAILEAVRVLRERQIPHGDLELVFTICEELGLLGAKHLDVSRIRAKTGLVLDSDGVDELITRAPAANRMVFTIHGLEAHAGVCPENGISAIKVAAEAITAMNLGRIDAETTANLGIIQGGTANNIVPKQVVVRGEARSRSVEKLRAQTKHMSDCFREAACRHRVILNGKEIEARVEERIERDYDLMDLPDDCRIVRLVTEAAKSLGRPFATRPTGGGCDANVLNGKGLQVANLGCGMRDIHTVNEWLDMRDLVRTAELVLEVVRLNAQT
jgi:tripeptide aminopeptidase